MSSQVRKKVIQIRDASIFAGPSFGTGGKRPAEPEYIVWDRYSTSKAVQVFTDGTLKLVQDPACRAARNIAILVESPAIRPHPYEWIRENGHLFDEVLTFMEGLSGLGAPFRFYPLGGSWIPVEEWGLHQKTKNVSVLVSQKIGQEGHRLRHEAAQLYGVDAYGRGVDNWIEDKADALRDYRFSVVTENTRANWYFTEKLVDCLSQGTIPIYWGCDLHPFFDMEGIIVFHDMEELARIVPHLTPYLYNSKYQAVTRNLRAARLYKCPEDWICRKLPGVLR